MMLSRFFSRLAAAARGSARAAPLLATIGVHRVAAVPFKARWAAAEHTASSAPGSTVPTAVLLQLGSSPFSRFAHAGALRLDRTTLLETVFGGKKTIAELAEYIVEATVGADDEPAAGAKWHQLKGLSTLDKLWEQHKSAGPFLHVRVRLPSAPAAAAAATSDLADWLASPAEFTCIDVGGHPMMRSQLPRAGGAVLTFFLEEEALTQMQNFVRDAHLSTLPQALVITGPVKSGKSTVLAEVLPRLIAADYRTNGARKPIVVRLALGGPPALVAKQLVYRVERAAHELGAPVPTIPSDPVKLLALFTDLMQELAAGIGKTGARLWVLLDELQSPFLNCETASEAMGFAVTLKQTVSNCAGHTRFAFTGSGMATLLNQLRMLPVNDYDFMDKAAFVQLGATPTDSAARAMAAELVASYSSAHRWTSGVVEKVTASSVLDTLASHRGLLSPRPALAAVLLGAIRPDLRACPADALVAAAESTLRKLLRESEGDFYVALERLDAGLRQALASLAHGSARSLNDLHLGDPATAFLALLCEPSRGEGQATAPPRLLPPYAALTRSMLNAEGRLLVHTARFRRELDEVLGAKLSFFADTYSGDAKRMQVAQPRWLNHRIHLQPISVRVLACLAANGIGASAGTLKTAVAGAADIDGVPVLRQLLHHRGNSILAEEHHNKLNCSDAEGRKALARYDEVIGFHVLRWIRNLCFHGDGASLELTRAGLPVAVVEAVVAAAEQALFAAPAYMDHVFERGSDAPIKRRSSSSSHLRTRR